MAGAFRLTRCLSVRRTSSCDRRTVSCVLAMTPRTQASYSGLPYIGPAIDRSPRLVSGSARCLSAVSAYGFAWPTIRGQWTVGGKGPVAWRILAAALDADVLLLPEGAPLSNALVWAALAVAFYAASRAIGWVLAGFLGPGRPSRVSGAARHRRNAVVR